MNEKIVNLVNFVRGIEPRWESDLFLPVKRQIEINKKYGVESTFLLQYDAMKRKEFRTLFLDERDERIEIGVWFENCRELIETIGLKWNGREGYDWDWHVNVGFLMGYEPKQRELIIDEVFRLFHEIFGEYPKVVGSWLMDAYSIGYICKKYGAKAFCVCREQHSVDAYTLWGGFSSGGYYPSKNNMLCPAQTEKRQISVPIFRMLGADAIYSYDEEKYFKGEKIGVYTMEPGWVCGQDSHIMDWYFESYYKNPCLSFSHCTTGQENSFGWETFGKAYEMQVEKLVKLQEEGVLTIEKLGVTGENFTKTYKETPPQVQIATKDWNGNGIKTAWYNCKNYRSNLFFKDGELFFRDIQKYDETYEERYLFESCKSWDATYDTLPIVDSRFWSKEGVSCGHFVEGEVADVEFIKESDLIFQAKVYFKDGEIGLISFENDGISFENISLRLNFGIPTDFEVALKGNQFTAIHNSFEYKFTVVGNLKKDGDEYLIAANNSGIKIFLD